MATSGGNQGGLLSASYGGFDLVGATGFELHVTGMHLCNIGTGATMLVDAGLAYSSGTMVPLLQQAPVSLGDPVKFNGALTVLGGQTLRLKASTANLVAANISYQRITV